MSRLHLLALVAVPALLSACDSRPSALSKAKPGECYAVVGRDATGGPKLSKTPCPGSPAAIAAACPAPSAGATGAAVPAACPAPGVQASGGGLAYGSGQGGGFTTASRIVNRVGRQEGVRRATVRTHRVFRERAGRAGEVHVRREYARADEGLAGGPSYENERYERREYARRDDYAPAPPPRVFERYEEERDYGYSRGHGETHGYRAESHAFGGGRKTYAPPPPPPAYEAHAYGREGRTEYSERRRSSASYRAESYSSSSSSSSRHVEVDCDCDGPVRGGGANPSPFDHNGFLTWRGKTPG